MGGRVDGSALPASVRPLASALSGVGAVEQSGAWADLRFTGSTPAAIL